VEVVSVASGTAAAPQRGDAVLSDSPTEGRAAQLCEAPPENASAAADISPGGLGDTVVVAQSAEQCGFTTHQCTSASQIVLERKVCRALLTQCMSGSGACPSGRPRLFYNTLHPLTRGAWRHCDIYTIYSHCESLYLCKVRDTAANRPKLRRRRAISHGEIKRRFRLRHNIEAIDYIIFCVVYVCAHLVVRSASGAQETARL
jgi:hypothetical protein